MFFTGLNEPKPTAMDFSPDGLSFLSAHGDDALRCIDVGALAHTDTIQCETFGVHNVRYTQSSQVACVAPRFPLDGHLHLLNVETAQFFGTMAYLNDLDSEIHPVVNTPVYSTIAQCPCTDVLGAVVSTKGRLALFHPLIAGCIAASTERSVAGARPALSFSPDGNLIVIGDDHKVTLFDRRILFSCPVACCENSDLFRENAKHARCKGAEVNSDGERVLLTSSTGEVVVYNWKLDQVVCSYYHDDARRHFLGSGDAVGAQYVQPYVPHSSIAQPSSSMNAGRHLLVYEGYSDSSIPADSAMEVSAPTSSGSSVSSSLHPLSSSQAVLSTSVRRGNLQYELQSKDSDVPVALAVNRRFQIVATAARNVTWWAFH